MSVGVLIKHLPSDAFRIVGAETFLFSLCVRGHMDRRTQCTIHSVLCVFFIYTSTRKRAYARPRAHPQHTHTRTDTNKNAENALNATYTCETRVSFRRECAHTPPDLCGVVPLTRAFVRALTITRRARTQGNARTLVLMCSCACHFSCWILGTSAAPAPGRMLTHVDKA